jgi:parvulin-like peptidyl-prolyl isomerase
LEQVEIKEQEMKRRVRFAAAALTGIALSNFVVSGTNGTVGAMLGGAKVWAAPGAPTGVAAEVNAEKIPLADVDRQLNAVKDAQPSLRGDTPEAKKALAQIRGTIVDIMVEWRLEVQEAKRQKVAAPPAELDKALAEYKKQYKSDAELNQVLAQEGKKPGDLRALIGETLQIEELKKRWVSDIVVNEDDIGTFYRENTKEFLAPEGVRVQHILVAVKPGASAEDKSRAKNRAVEILKKARAKDAEFGALAQQNSDDPTTKDRGGDLGGYITRNDPIAPAFLAAAFAGKTGEIAGPIETDFGFHILKVEEKQAARTLPLDEVREDLRAYLFDLKKQKAIAAKIQALKDKATIKKYV